MIFLFLALVASGAAGYGAVFAGTGDLPRSRKAGLQGMVRTAGATWSSEVRSDWTKKKKSWSKARVDRLAKRAKGGPWDKMVRRLDIMAAAGISAVRSNNRATWKAVRNMPAAYRAHQAVYLNDVYEAQLEAATEAERAAQVEPVTDQPPVEQPAEPIQDSPTKESVMSVISTEFANITEVTNAAQAMLAQVEEWATLVAAFGEAVGSYNGGTEDLDKASMEVTESVRGITAISEAITRVINAAEASAKLTEQIKAAGFKSTATVGEIVSS